MYIERKVVEQVLEALEKMMAEFRAYDLPYGSKAYAVAKDARLELFALLNHSEAKTQEPVAFDVKCDACKGSGLDWDDNNYKCVACHGSGFVEKLLYTAPPQLKSEQETIHCKHKRENNGVCPHHNLQCGWPKCNEPEQELCEYCKRGLKTMCLCGMKAQPEQEPVAHCTVRPLRGDEAYPKTEIVWVKGRPVAGPLYTTPPQRAWVGLTDKEMREVMNSVAYSPLAMTHAEWAHAVQKATEAKLKEKNT